jgi:hypothetical protein
MGTFSKVDSWTEMPLCRHYVVVHFDAQPIPLPRKETLCELRVSWALGVVRDGDWEVLGAWPQQDGGPTAWKIVFEKLVARGLGKHIPFILADACRDVYGASPDAAVLPPFGRILATHASVNSEIGQLGSEARRAAREAVSVRGARVALERLLPKLCTCGTGVLVPDWPEVLKQFEAFYALRPQRRALVRKGDEVLEHLSGTLNRAVVRHGAFANAEAATSFVASTLARAEQRLKYRDLVEQISRRPAAGPAGASFAVRGASIPAGCTS